MFRLVVLSCAVLVFAHGSVAQVSQCLHHSGALPINAHVEGCITAPCAVPQLQDAVINLEFATPGPVQSMRTLATAYYLLGTISLPIVYDLAENAETCNFLTNASCPVEEGQVLKYTLRMPISEIMPLGTKIDVEFRVVDEITYNPIVCLRVPITVLPPVA